MYGAILGDIVCCPYEFDCNNIKAMVLPLFCLRSDFTDDTVMALAVAVYAAGLPALLRGAEAVNKSWPAFWDTLRGLGAKIDTE